MSEVVVVKKMVAAHDGLVSSLKCAEAHIAHPPPHIPLQITDLLSENQSQIQPNSRTPVRVKNAHFDGHVLVKLKTTPADPYYELYFAKRRRMFEIQVQGRVKEVGTDEELYMGLECESPLRLGLWGRFACTLVLQLLHALSFGAHANAFCDDGSELPHIALPLRHSADRLIITRPGEEAPELSVDMLPEMLTKDKRSAVEHFDPENIYTMSFHSMYIDWATWELVNIPGLRPVSLSWFFADQPVRFVAYTMPKALKNGPHSPEFKKYLFSLELKSLIEPR